jgi:hypothetical protein
MNAKSRILPHLNVCYLQKKAYDLHRKKIDYIKHSLRSSIIKNPSKDSHELTSEQEQCSAG